MGLKNTTVAIGLLASVPLTGPAEAAGTDVGIQSESSVVLAVRDRYPDWSPDGTRIVFDSNRTGTQEIFVVDADAGVPVQLTHLGRRSTTPVFSPDGEWIAFASSEDEDPGVIFVMRADGTDLGQVTEPPQAGTSEEKPTFNDGHPKWAPDGKSIVFNRDVDARNAEIFEVNLDGTGLKRLTDKTDWDTYPSISPDGRYLLWRGVTPEGGQSESGRNSEVFIANRDGSEPRNITNHSAFDGYPAWLPGGEWVVFASNRDGESRFDFNLYAMRPDGSAVTKLTQTVPGVLQVRPSVSPDGRAIALNRDHFNGQEDETTWIYILRFDRPVSEMMEAEEE